MVDFYCRSIGYDFTEHILINANPRIIGTLSSFDYYEKIRAGIFVYDPK